MALKRIISQNVNQMKIRCNFQQLRLCTTSSSVDSTSSSSSDDSTSTSSSSSKQYPTISELFEKSLTCSSMTYKGKHIFLIGDKPSCPLSLERVNYTIKTLKPAVVCLEAENPFLGYDNNQFNQKDASWRQPNPTGTLILESYQNMHAEFYPNLAKHLDSYTPDNKQSHILKIRNICERTGSPMYYCGDELPDQLLKKSKTGQLEELTVQFREQFLREAKKAKERRDKHASVHGKQSVSFFGTMEGLDEKEQREQIELTRLVVEDLTTLTKMFPDDILMNAEQFRSMMKACNNVHTIDDYELIANGGLVRNAGLNEIIRSLDFDYNEHAEDFWTALKLLTVNRDRLLLRTLTEKVDEMNDKGETGIVLGVFNFIHIYGIETMWRNTAFWNAEAESKEYVKEMADRSRIEKELKDSNAPFFGEMDPPRDKDLEEAVKF